MEDEGHSLSPTEKTKEFKLEPDQELRFEVENDEQVRKINYSLLDVN